MNRVLVIARLTLQEALRRRLLAALLLITAALVGLSAWGFDRLSRTPTLTSGEVRAAVPQALILFMFMFSFVVALSASAIASPAISAELDSGVLASVAARPISRAELLLGKWIGLAVVLAGYAGVVSALEFGVVDWVSGFVPPDPLAAACYLFAEGAILLTISLLLSTRLSALAAGVLGVALFGAAWLAGVVGALGTSFHISTLVTVGRIARLVLPTDGLWHGAIYALEPQSFIVERVANGSGGNPFFATGGLSWPYLVFVGCWFLIVLGAAWWSFERREL